jgi:hypothetical protein
MPHKHVQNNCIDISALSTIDTIKIVSALSTEYLHLFANIVFHQSKYRASPDEGESTVTSLSNHPTISTIFNTKRQWGDSTSGSGQFRHCLKNLIPSIILTGKQASSHDS